MQTGNRFLYALVFVVGMASLGAEIAAARLMAPYFGASTIVWANTIGVVLVALSIGYWLGGRLGDRYPRPRELCLVVGAAALLLAVVPFAARPFFDISVDALEEISAGAFVGSLVGVLFLVAIPVVMLGTASPWAIRLAVTDVEHAGARRRAASTRSRPRAPCSGRCSLRSSSSRCSGTQRTFLVFAVALGTGGGGRARVALPRRADRARGGDRRPGRVGRRDRGRARSSGRARPRSSTSA